MSYIYIYIYTDYTYIENIYTYIGVLHMHMFSFPTDNSFTIVTIEEFGNIVSKSLKNDLVLPLKSILSQYILPVLGATSQMMLGSWFEENYYLLVL